MATAKKKPTITLSPSRDIPFNQLVLSQSNVRRIKAGVSVEELAEDIARRGILQGLTVRPVVDQNGAETGMFEVPAGGRRVRALELLVKQKRLAKTAPVPCVVREGGIAEEDSLAENVQRAPLHPLDQFRAFLTLREKGQSEEEVAAAFFVSVNVVKQRLKLASVSTVLLDVYAEDGMTLAQLEAFTVSGDHARQEQVFERLKTSYDKSAYAIRRMLTEGAVRATDKRVQFIGIEAYVEAGGTVLRDLFEGDDGGWLQDVALVDQMVADKLGVESEAIAAEGWKWTEFAPDFAYGHTYGLRRLHGEPMPLTDEEEAARDALKAEFDRLVAQHEGADELPEEVDERLGELETALEAFDERPPSFDAEEMARAGAFISIAGDGRLRVDRGYVRPEDEAPAEPERASDCATGAGGTVGDDADGDHNINSDSVADPEEDEGLSPISDRLRTELTAHRTLGLRHALGEHPDVAFSAALHALTLKVFYQYGSDSCLELDLKTVSFGAQAPGLNDSVSAEAIRARHESWTKALPQDSADLWDALHDWDSDSRAALFAHVVSLSVNAVHEAWNRRPRALAHADQLADAVDLDMSARWNPTVDTFLGRVTKARILQAVVEAKGQRAADRIAHLKKGDMATEATTLLNGTGWLPEPLRTPGRKTVADMSPVELAVAETAEVADETAIADDDGIADDDDVAAMTIAAE
ncbi:MAG: ParB/RepB/Spo0J family partition protein [Mesorhizobium sp.]|uniref:ParB/RepB/Spo0J family partition protein n=1 Tax=Mesorhizobium sp. TaxID=1871066 RepID=UPI000FE7171D|nr:ParB/RepB/Spo0J family partition protein [Mesorhizobium sp.]RWH76956.1 MAG: ParB/RepB/Spo0J family partition protein [Mesorhizobium sp.]RWH80266.1 MAG: ParB/RepB/Spo0J family partition protein [Mesorhizobium sp.]RWH88656.1 MAG: ParB/RepB/Spo0J family partition protein [Mesorhizobium sp.]RWH95512.1 MAG: ParB/RepB/Spo0J family partition protein [Mesorhizobium sp.]RWI14151.1 MAG: ParB/RepB/Spo0J family partition protein [Mesorhizobium sp.]